MGLTDELRDPWGLVVAGVSGGMAWAVLGASPVAAAAGVGVGAAVLGVKAVTGLVVRRDRRSPVQVPARPPRGTVAARFFAQAEAAVRALDDMAAGAGTGAAADAVRAAADGADDTLRALARVGAQVTAVEAALARVDVPGLDAEAARLADAARRAPSPEVRAEVERSAASLRDRVQVRDRLRSTREALLARMQSTTLGLEGIVARLAEVQAMTAGAGWSDTSAQDVASLAAGLDGLRAGLAESEAVSRRVLAAEP